MRECWRIPMTFRPYLLLTLLAFAAHGAGQAPSGAAPDPAPGSPTTGRAATGRGIPDSTRVDKQQVLFAKHDSDNYVGLVILLPDWQRSGQLWQLTRSWGASVSIPCCCSLAAADRARPRRREETAGHRRFSQAVCLPHQQAGDAKLQEGFKLLLAQGTSAAWAANLIASEQLPAPDALVLLGRLLPQPAEQPDPRQADSPGQHPYPGSLSGGGRTLALLAAEARRSESRRSHKLNYRPYALMDLEETPGRIQGWLTHLGWI